MRSGSPTSRRRLVEGILGGLWVLYTGAYFLFYAWFESAEEIGEASLAGYLEVMLLAMPAVLLFGAVVGFHRMDTDRVSTLPVVYWTVGFGILFVVAMYTAMFIIEAVFDPGERWLVLLLSAGLGMSAGCVVGLVQVRSRKHERERNRFIAQQRRTERERKQLEYLNQALRHEVLNGTQKIDGYTSLLREQVGDDTDTARWLEISSASNDDIAEFIQSIRQIMDITDHEPDLEPVDVVSVIEEEASLVQQDGPAQVDVEGPDSAFVLAGDLANRVFRNLFDNAIEHNDDDVEIGVTVETGEESEWVCVRVRDDGSGIPDSKCATVFEPPQSGDHGYGLYLVDNLVELYGGTLDLVETGPEGTEFLVRLPAVASPDDYSPAPRPVSPTRSA
jgi:signal transduction histidine kinase